MSNLELNPLENFGVPKILSFPEDRRTKTPVYSSILAEAELLDQKSAYRSNFDYKLYRDLELRYADRPIRGGVTMKTAFRLVNSHSTCQQCLYAFEIDTYGRGCIHDCAYCYAKAELTAHGYWNNPIPVPININEIRNAFHVAFETDKKHRWKELLLKRVPLRIGSMSDSFMWTDKKYGVTKELLRILKFYNYPYIVFTRSDLIAEDEYLNLLDRNLAAIQFSISSTNDALTKIVEPGAPSPTRRLKALKKLSENGIWTTVRLNPFFPIYPDGYFSNPNFSWKGKVPNLNFSTFEMVDEIAAAGVPAALAGFVRLSSYSLNRIEKSLDFNLREFFNRDEVLKSARDWHYSDAEIREYYKRIKERCDVNGVQFTTCYIGNGEHQFWRDQDLWSNKKDCCNAKTRVQQFQTDARSIPFETRLKYTNHKSQAPVSNTLSNPLGQLSPEGLTPL